MSPFYDWDDILKSFPGTCEKDKFRKLLQKQGPFQIAKLLQMKYHTVRTRIYNHGLFPYYKGIHGNRKITTPKTPEDRRLVENYKEKLDAYFSRYGPVKKVKAYLKKFPSNNEKDELEILIRFRNIQTGRICLICDHRKKRKNKIICLIGKEIFGDEWSCSSFTFRNRRN